MTSPVSPHRPAVIAAAQRVLPDHLVPLHSGGSAVWWSHIKREGEWILPRIFRVFTFMGNVELDLTFARMGQGTSEIEVRCVFGNIEIRVPPDIRVICDGEALAGSFELVRVGEVTTPHEDAPILRVKGNAYFGAVTVKVMGYVGPGWKDKLVAGWKSLNS